MRPWRDWFKSNYTCFLERSLDVMREDHARQIRRITEENDKRLDDLKTAHAAERNHVIEENQKLLDELTKVRYVEKPALQSIKIGEDNTPPPTPSEIPQGTPWQRVQRKYALEQEAEAARKYVKPAEAPVPGVEGAPDGSVREGRVEAPLGKPSVDARPA
jgi:hypothetical protein